MYTQPWPHGKGGSAAAAMMAAAEALKHAVAPNECPFFLLFVHPYKVDGTAMMLLDES